MKTRYAAKRQPLAMLRKHIALVGMNTHRLTLTFVSAACACAACAVGIACVPIEDFKEKHMASNQKKERYILVTTEHRGVFAGFATDTDGEVINLRGARNCIYWSMELKGFLGLASVGPDKSCRIGPAADIQLRKITAVVEVTPEAQVEWERAPWSK